MLRTAQRNLLQMCRTCLVQACPCPAPRDTRRGEGEGLKGQVWQFPQRQVCTAANAKPEENALGSSRAIPLQTVTFESFIRNHANFNTKNTSAI